MGIIREKEGTGDLKKKPELQKMTSVFSVESGRDDKMKEVPLSLRTQVGNLNRRGRAEVWAGDAEGCPCWKLWKDDAMTTKQTGKTPLGRVFVR